MFDGLTRQQAKSKAIEIIGEFCVKFPANSYDFKEGDRIQYAGHIFDDKEIMALVDCALDYWLAGGRFTEEFELKLGEFLGIKNVSLVNSGSSANLIAFMALTSPLLKERAIKRGDEVITVAAGFPTTVTPIIQFGAIPVFVDVTIPQYNIDVTQLDLALSSKTKAVMIAHTLGNPFDVSEVKKFCDKNNLWLIEDNCDALGSQYMLDGQDKYTGTIGDIGTSSFYPPHHMTMGEGGAVYTNNPLLHKIIRSMRDWGRDCICPPGKDNFCGNRFGRQFGLLPEGYDHKYVYSHFGYNLKATDMQAAIGCEQLRKLPDFIHKRINNFNRLNSLLSDLTDVFILPEACMNAKPSWFGFLLTCRRIADRNKIVEYLEGKNIQTRMLFAGNILYHPCFTEIDSQHYSYRTVGELKNTDTIMNSTFWIGVYPGMTEDKLLYISKAIHEACALINGKDRSYV